MEEKFCQSCGMPMTTPKATYGRNADGSLSSDYCSYCYQDGRFQQEATMAQMIDHCIPFMAEACHITPEEARREMNGFYPKLKRWRDNA